VLVYSRVSWNRRNAFLLPLGALLLSAPLPVGVSLAFSAGAMAVAASVALMLAPCLVLWGMLSNQTPKMLGIFGARLAGETEQRLLENLSIGAGLPKPKLFVIESGAPNAFAIGVPGRAIIGVTRALLDLLDHQELEGVLAHELSHIGNRDTQLNDVVAALVLFMQLPQLLRRRRASIEQQTRLGYEPLPNVWGRAVWLLLSPLWCYIFLVAPLLGALLRGVISRDRELLADADAALLTRYPEGLIRALAKIEGVGRLVGATPAVAHFYFADAVATKDDVFGTHPNVSQRIARLVEIHGEISPEIVKSAVEAGASFAREHPVWDGDGLQVQDELSVLNMGNVMGKVYRAVSPGCVYDKADVKSAVLAQVTQGSLLVVFDDPGAFRQVLTARGVFGYLPRRVRLEATDMIPAEVRGGR